MTPFIDIEVPAQQLARRKVVTAEDRLLLWFGNSLIESIVGSAETEGRFTLGIMHGPGGDDVPLHLHKNEDEAFFVLEGEITIWQGDQTAVIGPEEFVLLPKEVPHCYKVTSPQGARWLAITAPTGFEDFVAKVVTPATERRLPRPEEAPFPDLMKMVEYGNEAGVTFLGPPGVRPADVGLG
ncbi:cupin domain-containing protein [Nocardia beijingensis]|uniref:cupin domain-containing protein n=1 Tax=Nocardia beijingensis TaxID=95162 RepID=UPI0033D61A8A